MQRGSVMLDSNSAISGSQKDTKGTPSEKQGKPSFGTKDSQLLTGIQNLNASKEDP